MFARNGGGDVAHGNTRRSFVCHPDSLDWVPEKRRELCRYAVSRGGRHGILLWHRSCLGITFPGAFEPMIRLQFNNVCYKLAQSAPARPRTFQALFLGFAEVHSVRVHGAGGCIAASGVIPIR